LPDNTIVAGSPGISGLLRVSADGGTLAPLIELPDSFMFPMSFVAEASSLVVWSSAGTSPVGSIEALRIDNAERRPILEGVGPGMVTAGGHLVFTRDEALFAAPFDRRRLLVTSDPVPLPDTISQSNAIPQMAVADTGVLAYIPVHDAGHVIGKARSSEFTTLVTAPGFLSRPRVSPEGERIAYVVRERGRYSLEVRDIARATTTKVLESNSDIAAAWHPGGRAIAVGLLRDNRPALVLRELGGDERLLLKHDAFQLFRLGSFSPDGSTLAYVRQTGNPHEIWTLSLSDGRTAKYFDGPRVMHSPTFSPDGRLIAFVAGSISADSEIHVRHLQTRATTVVARGQNPVWDRTGRALYFSGESAGEPALMVVSVRLADGALQLGVPTVALRRYARTEAGAAALYLAGSNGGPGYDVFPDGQFAVVRTPDPRDAREIVVVQNWFDELNRLASLR
jgi:hypothetical protein